MLVNRCRMAKTEMSKDYDRKQLELLKKGCCHGSARFYAAIYARARERKRNADKSGG